MTIFIESTSKLILYVWNSYAKLALKEGRFAPYQHNIFIDKNLNNKMKKRFFWHMKKIRETNIFVTNNFLLRNQNDNVNSNFVKLDKANLIFYSFYSGI